MLTVIIYILLCIVTSLLLVMNCNKSSKSFVIVLFTTYNLIYVPYFDDLLCILFYGDTVKSLSFVI